MIFRQQKRRQRRDDERNHHQRQRMCQPIAILNLTLWKSLDQLHDPLAEIKRQRKDRTELDDDRVHLPIRLVQRKIEQLLADAQVSGRTDRKELRQTFHDSE